MASLVAAMSRASTSGVNRAKAFLDPSGLHVVSPYPRVLVVHSAIPDERVDLDAVHIVQLLQRILDLSLVGLNVNNENQCVVLLNLLHRTLSVERVDDNFVGIETWLVRDGLSWVSW